MAKLISLILVLVHVCACGEPFGEHDLSEFYISANLQRQETSPFRHFESEEDRVQVFSNWLKQQANTRSIFFQEASPAFRTAVQQSGQFQWVEPKNAFESYENLNSVSETLPAKGVLGAITRLGGLQTIAAVGDMAQQRWASPPSYQGIAIPKDSRVLGDVVFEPSSRQSIHARLIHNSGVTYVPVEHRDGSRELIATWHFDHDEKLSVEQQQEAIATLSKVRKQYPDFSFRGGGDTNNNLLREAWSEAGFHLPPEDLGATYDPINNHRAKEAVTGNSPNQATSIDHVILANPVSPSSSKAGNIEEATWSIRPSELPSDHYIVSAFVPDDRRWQSNSAAEEHTLPPTQ